jgi:hypothetical protein
VKRRTGQNRSESGKPTFFNVDWKDVELHPDISEWVVNVEGEAQYYKC